MRLGRRPTRARPVRRTPPRLPRTVGKVGSCGQYLCDVDEVNRRYNGPTRPRTPGRGGHGGLRSSHPSTPPVIPAAPGAPTLGAATQTTVGLSWVPSVRHDHDIYSGLIELVRPAGVGVTAGRLHRDRLSRQAYYLQSRPEQRGTSAQSSVSSTTTLALADPVGADGLAATAGNGSVSLNVDCTNVQRWSAITGATSCGTRRPRERIEGSSYAPVTTASAHDWAPSERGRSTTSR